MYFNFPKPSVWLSLEAIKLSDELITTLEIPQGSGLADLLNVNKIFYNHEAVRIWVQRELDNGLPYYGRVSELVNRFMICVTPSDNCYFYDEMSDGMMDMPLGW